MTALRHNAKTLDLINVSDVRAGAENLKAAWVNSGVTLEPLPMTRISFADQNR